MEKCSEMSIQQTKAPVAFNIEISYCERHSKGLLHLDANAALWPEKMLIAHYSSKSYDIY